jgi:hypothetical protein
MAAKHVGMGWNFGGVETKFIVGLRRCYELRIGPLKCCMNAHFMDFIE